MKTETGRRRVWVRYIVGGVGGAVVGGVAALNVMIYSGVEGGYEAGLGALFEHNPLAGSAAVALLVAGPLLGVLTARWMQRSG